jgi:hypothetical protein
MNPELLQILIAFAGAVLGYFLRHLQIKPLPGPVPGPTPGPGPAPGPAPDYPLLNQLLELLRRLLSQQAPAQGLGVQSAMESMKSGTPMSGVAVTVPVEFTVTQKVQA